MSMGDFLVASSGVRVKLGGFADLHLVAELADSMRQALGGSVFVRLAGAPRRTGGEGRK
jgi:hypothetical protein